jgi:hypothetical protein
MMTGRTASGTAVIGDLCGRTGLIRLGCVACYQLMEWCKEVTPVNSKSFFPWSASLCMRRLSSDWESTRLKIELSPVQIREAASGFYAFSIRVAFALIRKSSCPRSRERGEWEVERRAKRVFRKFTIREAAYFPRINEGAKRPST